MIKAIIKWKKLRAIEAERNKYLSGYGYAWSQHMAEGRTTDEIEADIDMHPTVFDDGIRDSCREIEHIHNLVNNQWQEQSLTNE